ncbi:conserved hypothetical protein [Neospora caninum Liverpool]|uniref:Transmembrane protein n=1 Tax=Neospora caninum (strain Liverpool) TaxID=572307 RepID=F0V9I2_NEOCL|nr:conserved hypothetical protein [Neospora caninum Liverpool]CBZ50407.1 conserved hypothetical protein [Neospora caninum Liverpool]CEL65015.1 TPA: hypothetical protein BN1204_008760 [Neospora caninum Liverpool]|eukprot:XP_003880441.1 conserved hypothetical protein [Neospora caninum Liverpool]
MIHSPVAFCLLLRILADGGDTMPAQLLGAFLLSLSLTGGMVEPVAAEHQSNGVYVVTSEHMGDDVKQAAREGQGRTPEVPDEGGRSVLPSNEAVALHGENGAGSKNGEKGGDAFAATSPQAEAFRGPEWTGHSPGRQTAEEAPADSQRGFDRNWPEGQQPDTSSVPHVTTQFDHTSQAVDSDQGQKSEADPAASNHDQDSVSSPRTNEPIQHSTDFPDSDGLSPLDPDYGEGYRGDYGDFSKESVGSSAFSGQNDDYVDSSDGGISNAWLRHMVRLMPAEKYCALKAAPPSVLYTPPGLRPEDLEALDIFAVRDEGYFRLQRGPKGRLVCPTRRRGQRVLFRSLRLENGELVGDMVFFDPRIYRAMIREVPPDGAADKRRSQPDVRGASTEGSKSQQSDKETSWRSQFLCKLFKRLCRTQTQPTNEQDEEGDDQKPHKRQRRLIVAAGVPLREVHGIKPLEIFDWKVKELLHRLERESVEDHNTAEGSSPYSPDAAQATDNAPEFPRAVGIGAGVEHGANVGDPHVGNDAERPQHLLATQSASPVGSQAASDDAVAPMVSGKAALRRLSEHPYVGNDAYMADAEGSASDGGVVPEDDWGEADYDDEPEIYIPDFLFSFPTNNSHVDDEPNTLEKETTSVDLKVTVLCLEDGAPPILVKEWPSFLNVVKPRKGVPQKPRTPRKSSVVWGSSVLGALAAGVYAMKRIVNPAALRFDSRDERVQSVSLLGLLSAFVAGTAALAGATAWKARTAIHSSHLRHNLREELFEEDARGDASDGRPLRKDFIFYYDHHFSQLYNP